MSKLVVIITLVVAMLWESQAEMGKIQSRVGSIGNRHTHRSLKWNLPPPKLSLVNERLYVEVKGGSRLYEAKVFVAVKRSWLFRFKMNLGCDMAGELCNGTSTAKLEPGEVVIYSIRVVQDGARVKMLTPKKWTVE